VPRWHRYARGLLALLFAQGFAKGLVLLRRPAKEA
jgi:hypothetical protein